MDEQAIKKYVDNETKGLLIELAAWETIIQSLPEMHIQMVEGMKEKQND